MAPPTHARSRSVCIVEDNDDVSEILAFLVRRLGYEVECIAHGGAEILRAFESGKRPGLILMDYRMQDMNGLEAARIVLKIDPNVKITICSADDSAREAASAAGFDFLGKPFSSSALALSIANSFKS